MTTLFNHHGRRRQQRSNYEPIKNPPPTALSATAAAVEDNLHASLGGSILQQSSSRQSSLSDYDKNVADAIDSDHGCCQEDDTARVPQNHDATTTTTVRRKLQRRSIFGPFFALGLLNNAPYVIMLAAAKNISEGGTAIVYIVNVVPSLTLKLSAPYWFDAVSYHTRILTAAACMFFAFVTVSYFSSNNNNHSSSTSTTQLIGQLVGVALISLQCGLGEASLLALAGAPEFSSKTCPTTDDDVDENDASEGTEEAMDHGDTERYNHLATPTTTPSAKTKKTAVALTAFSSGTGMAGPVGFLWKVGWTEWMGVSMRVTAAMSAIVLAGAYAGIYCRYVWTATTSTSNNMDDHANGAALKERQPLQIAPCEHNDELCDQEGGTMKASQQRGGGAFASLEITHASEQSLGDALKRSDNLGGGVVMAQAHAASDMPDTESTRSLDDDSPGKFSFSNLPPLSEMSAYDRLWLVVTQLWRYTIPLFTVYAAEYACQSGAWTALALPSRTTDAAAQSSSVFLWSNSSSNGTMALNVGNNDTFTDTMRKSMAPLALPFLQSDEGRAARARFYEISNWLYQAGVCVSRSSGALLDVNMTWLWIMPGLQVCNLVFFSLVAWHQTDTYNNIEHEHEKESPWHWMVTGMVWNHHPAVLLYSLSFFTGLLGGAVYVHGYKRILHDVPAPYTEFALSAVSVAEGLGVLVADVSGLFLQACLYAANGIANQAAATCPWKT